MCSNNEKEEMAAIVTIVIYTAQLRSFPSRHDPAIRVPQR